MLLDLALMDLKPSHHSGLFLLFCISRLLMYQNSKQYDVIDLDPYGSAGPFIDPAVHSISAGGLLCVTCTDMSVMCGNYGETCFTKYGAFSIKATYSHEMVSYLVFFAL